MNEPKIAVVGSGPAGCYTAQALLKDWPGARITVFDRLPVPYGLVRYGIATDHQGTKNITRQFDRLFQGEGVSFVGNVHVGTDISLEDLRALFDVVVLSTGLSADRPLAIPGSHLAGVYGSGHLTRWLNSHPGDVNRSPELGSDVLIIGNGNVAIDLVRLLARGPEDFEGTDIHDSVLGQLTTASVRRIRVIGRASAAEAKFDTVMIKELAKISGLEIRIKGTVDAAEAADTPHPKVSALQDLAAHTRGNLRVEVEFIFGCTPVRLEGTDKVTSAIFTDATGSTISFPADSVLTAIGFAGDSGTGLGAGSEAIGTSTPRPYRLDTGLYCAGWFRRGAQGTIPENRNDAKAVAAFITDDLRSGPTIENKPGVDGLPSDIREMSSSFADWKRIDAAETAAARPGRIRSKFLTTKDMLTAATDTPTDTAPLEGALK